MKTHLINPNSQHQNLTFNANFVSTLEAEKLISKETYNAYKNVAQELTKSSDGIMNLIKISDNKLKLIYLSNKGDVFEAHNAFINPEYMEATKSKGISFVVEDLKGILSNMKNNNTMRLGTPFAFMIS